MPKKAAQVKDMTEEHISVTDELENDKKTIKRIEQEAALDDLARGLVTEFGKFASAKEPIEMRMLQDYSQYQGQYFQTEDTEFNEILRDPQKLKKVSKVFVNATRSRTNNAEATLCDMLFPSDDRSWNIEATPVPDLPAALKNNQPLQLDDQPVMMEGAEGEEPREMTEADLSRQDLEEAKERAMQMRTEIDDQFVECQYQVQARNSIKDGTKLGTGIIKGPMQVGRVRKVWVPKLDTENNEQVHVLEIKEEIKPNVYSVSPWNFFPDLSAGNDIRNCPKTYEISYKTPLQMKEYLRTPGFMEPQVRKAMEAGVEASQLRRGTTHVEWIRRLAGLNTVGYDDSRYQVVEYHGPIDKEVLVRLGVDIDPEDPMDCQEGFVWMVGDIIIKLALHHLDSKDKLYSVFNWEEDEGCIFGYGVPYTMRAPQKVINASWRMVLDNAGLSTGPQIVINKDAVEPADGDWTLSPRKIWHALEEDTDVTKAFATFNIESHQQELLQIFNEAKRLVEEETNLSNVAQGMQQGAGTAGRSFSGLSMLMNNSNITLKRAVKSWDDNITLTLIPRMYDWNMQFNKKNSIKGDFSIKALGSSSLLVKELQSQGLLALLPYIGHEVIGPYLKTDEILRAVIKSLHIDPSTVVKDADTIKQEQEAAQKAAEQGPQITPDTQAKIESQERIEESRVQTKQDEMQLKLMLAEREVEKLIATLASKEGISREQVMANYELTLSNQEWDVQKFYDELAVKMEKGTGI